MFRPFEQDEKRVITYKTVREISAMRRAGEVIAHVFEACSMLVRPGTTTSDLDRAIENLIVREGAVPALKGLYGFPAATCISVNDQVLHGVPGDRVLRGGDLVTVDVGVAWDGFHADAARTFAVGGVSDEARRLLKATSDSLECGISECRPGKKLSDIARQIEAVAQREGFGIVEGYAGHGVGTSLHEEPEVPNRVTRRLLRRDLTLEVGLVLAIEPLLRVGSGGTRVTNDGWTVVTDDARLSAHFEDTVAITEDGPEVLTRPGHAQA